MGAAVPTLRGAGEICGGGLMVRPAECIRPPGCSPCGDVPGRLAGLGCGPVLKTTEKSPGHAPIPASGWPGAC